MTCPQCETVALLQGIIRFLEAAHSHADSPSGDEDSCAAEPDGPLDVPVSDTENVGSTPTAATNEPPEGACIFCAKNPCDCANKFSGWPLADRLDFTPDEPAEDEEAREPLPGIDVG